MVMSCYFSFWISFLGKHRQRPTVCKSCLPTAPFEFCVMSCPYNVTHLFRSTPLPVYSFFGRPCVTIDNTGRTSLATLCYVFIDCPLTSPPLGPCLHLYLVYHSMPLSIALCAAQCPGLCPCMSLYALVYDLVSLNALVWDPDAALRPCLQP